MNWSAPIRVKQWVASWLYRRRKRPAGKVRRSKKIHRQTASRTVKMNTIHHICLFYLQVNSRSKQSLSSFRKVCTSLDRSSDHPTNAFRIDVFVFSLLKVNDDTHSTLHPTYLGDDFSHDSFVLFFIDQPFFERWCRCGLGNGNDSSETSILL